MYVTSTCVFLYLSFCWDKQGHDWAESWATTSGSFKEFVSSGDGSTRIIAFDVKIKQVTQTTSTLIHP